MAVSIEDGIKVLHDALAPDRLTDPLMVAAAEAGLSLLQGLLQDIHRLADAAEALARRS